MNLANMMKQAQQVQKRLQDAQKDLASTEINGIAGNGSVTVTCDGQGKFKNIVIRKDAINPEHPETVEDETIEMLEALVNAAMKEATNQAGLLMQNKMKGIIPAGVNIPGLF